MAARTIYGTHGVDPYASPPWPAQVNDDADVIAEARGTARKLKAQADKIRLSQRELSATTPIYEALYEAEVLLSNAAAEADAELDRRGFVS